MIIYMKCSKRDRERANKTLTSKKWFQVCRPLEAISIENLFSTCHISIQEARHLLHRIDDIESRLKALEGPQPTVG